MALVSQGYCTKMDEEKRVVENSDEKYYITLVGEQGFHALGSSEPKDNFFL